MRKAIANLSSFSITNNLGRYLGTPLLHECVNRATFYKLSGWCASSLSLARRTTLVKSVLTTLPSFMMHATELPLSICDEIDKLCQGFTWGSKEEKKRSTWWLGIWSRTPSVVEGWEFNGWDKLKGLFSLSIAGGFWMVRIPSGPKSWKQSIITQIQRSLLLWQRLSILERSLWGPELHKSRLWMGSRWCW